MLLRSTDIYFDESYGKLYKSDFAELKCYHYEEGENKFLNISLQNPIQKIQSNNLENLFFDRETPYGYSGVYYNTSEKGFLENALKSYFAQVDSNEVIAEFFRFNPFLLDTTIIRPFFDFFLQERQTVAVPLHFTHDEIFKRYRSSLRRNIRRARKNSLTFKEVGSKQNSKYLEIFHSMYSKTMSKKGADSFYFFDISYFKELMKHPQSKMGFVLLDDNFISGIIWFETQNIVYYHLGCTEPEFYHLNPNPFMFDEVIKKYSNRAQEGYFFLGGGNSNSPDDPLFKFKLKFSDVIFPFYIAGKIYNKKKYDHYCKMRDLLADYPVNKFLNYRF